MNILMIDSQRVNYIDPGEYARSPTQRSYTLDVTSNPSDAQLAWADGIIAFHSVAIDASMIAKMSRCGALIKATIGLDDVDTDALRARHILYSNVGLVGVEEVAEHAMALILLAQRKLLEFRAHTQQGGWSWRAHSGEIKACSDTVLGLIGYGATGRALARRAAAMGYQICFFDPAVEQCADGMADRETLEGVLQKADVLSLHLPLTPHTRHLLNDQSFSRMKPRSTLVNTARGAIVDSDALLRALDSGCLSMALLDVVQEEPFPPQALINHERVLLTPHAAFYSTRSLAQLKIRAVEKVLSLLQKKMSQSVIAEHAGRGGDGNV